MKFKESSLLKKHKQLLGNKRDKRKKVVKSTSPTPDLKKAVIKKQEGGTLFSIYNSIDPYIPPTIDFNAPELETEIVTNPIKKRQAKVIEEAKKSTANSEVQELKEINSEIPSKKIPKSSETWKSPYSNKNEWVSDLTNAYKKAGITNDNAIRMLISQDALESGWGRSAQGKFNFGNLTTGSSWKGAYVEGKDHDAKGNPIKQRFRAYDSMDEYAADKIQFLKRLYDFDENDDIDKFISKLSGANKGKRRYAEATNYATSLANVYNKFAEGGIIKAQNGSKSEELLVKKALEFGQKTSEKMSPYDVRLIDFIKSKEGFRPKPEKDKTDGKWTVGYGLTDPKLIRKYRNGITEEEASKHLIQHLQMGADSLATMPYYDNLNLGEKTALNDLIYNIGWNKFKNSKRLQSHLKAGNDAGAKKEMNHGEHQARGLKIRRNQNRQMYDSTFNWKYKKGGVVKYQPGGKTYTGSTSTNYYGDVVHHLPVWNKDGETNVGLPEVVVTPRNNLNLGEAVNRGRDAAGNVGKEILSAVTPLGDIESAKGIYNDFKEGNYTASVLGLTLLALPNFISKPFRKLKSARLKAKFPEYVQPNYKGDSYELTKERLQNGGFDRLERYRSRIVDDYEDYRREGILKSSPEIVDSPTPESNNPGVATYRKNYVLFRDKLDKYTNRQQNDILSHEFAHYVYEPTESPDIDQSDWIQYFKNRNGTEQSARGTQLKNYFGLDRGDQNITPEMWEYAKLNYVNDTGIDNYMSYWFNKVKPKDIEKYVKWLNENSVAVATPLLLSNGNSESK
jgi:GH24 family phage-related lysozyme (muramidase)/flagellum-specific peptidoglycan hydrolase FlgJ